MIKYRPHRSTLSESMELCKSFETLDEMISYVESEWNSCVISVDIRSYTDDRIGWNNWHYVMADGYVAGMCDIQMKKEEN